MVWFHIGVAFLGLVIGILTGLSRTSVVGTALMLIITFAGGSILAILRHRDRGTLKLIGKGLFFFSVGVLAGCFFAMYLKFLWPVIHQLAPPPPRDLFETI